MGGQGRSLERGCLFGLFVRFTASTSGIFFPRVLTVVVIVLTTSITFFYCYHRHLHLHLWYSDHPRHHHHITHHHHHHHRHHYTTSYCLRPPALNGYDSHVYTKLTYMNETHMYSTGVEWIRKTSTAEGL